MSHYRRVCQAIWIRRRPPLPLLNDFNAVEDDAVKMASIRIVDHQGKLTKPEGGTLGGTKVK